MVEILDCNINKLTDTGIKLHKAPSVYDSFRVKMSANCTIVHKSNGMRGFKSMGGICVYVQLILCAGKIKFVKWRFEGRIDAIHKQEILINFLLHQFNAGQLLISNVALEKKNI